MTQEIVDKVSAAIMRAALDPVVVENPEAQELWEATPEDTKNRRRLAGAAAIAEYQKILDESGYVIVPREPTQEMLDAGWYEAHEEDAAGTWRAMIEAVPKPPGDASD